MHSVDGIDSTAIQYIQEILDSYQKKGVTVYWTHVQSSIKAALARTGITKGKEVQTVFMTTHDAVEHIMKNNKVEEITEEVPK